MLSDVFKVLKMKPFQGFSAYQCCIDESRLTYSFSLMTVVANVHLNFV